MGAKISDNDTKYDTINYIWFKYFLTIHKSPLVHENLSVTPKCNIAHFYMNLSVITL